MVVSVGKNKANWASLYPSLENGRDLPVPATVQQQTSEQPVQVAPEIVDKINSKWSSVLTPSFEIVSAKKLGLKGTSRPNGGASGDYGHEWGTAVHELLEVQLKSPNINLRPTALRLSREHNLGTNRTDELLDTVASVAKSDVWKRAQSSQRCYSELPFDTTITTADGIPQLIRGVIDLIFEEADGWVIVDYKTDDITEDQIISAINYYESQLETYARFWTEITDFQVHELGFYLTRLDRYVSAPANQV